MANSYIAQAYVVKYCNPPKNLLLVPPLDVFVVV